MIKEIDEFVEDLSPTINIMNVYEVHPMGKDEIHFDNEEEFMELEPRSLFIDNEGNKWTYGAPDTWFILRNNK